MFWKTYPNSSTESIRRPASSLLGKAKDSVIWPSLACSEEYINQKPKIKIALTIRRYQPKEDYFLDLDKHASTNTGVPLVLIGDSGSGKSALLANWANRYQQHHPESIVITHFIGCSPASSNYGGLLLRVMNELLALLRDSSQVPTDIQTAVGMWYF